MRTSQLKKIIYDVSIQFVVVIIYAILAMPNLQYFGKDTLLMLSTGFALAVVLIGGHRFFWPLFLSAILVNLNEQSSIAVGILMALSSAYTPLLISTIIRVYCTRKLQIFTLQSFRSSKVILSAAIGTMLMSIFTSCVLFAIGQIEAQHLIAFVFKGWMADILGVMVLTPLIIHAWYKFTVPNTSDIPSHALEASLAVLCTIFVGLIIFFNVGHDYLTHAFIVSPTIISNFFWLYVILGWSIWRLEKYQTHLIILVVALMGGITTHDEQSYFFITSVNTSSLYAPLSALVTYWIYLIVYCAIGIILSEVITQYRVQLLKILNQYSELNFKLNSKNIMFDISRARMYAMIDDLPIAIWYKDKEGNIIAANKTMANILGFDDLTFVLHKKNAQIFSKKLSRVFDADDAEVLASGQPKTTEITIRHAGQLKLFKSTVLPVYDIDGKISGVVGYHLDLTEQKQQLADLAISEQRINTLIAITKEGIWDWNISTDIVHHNKQWFNLLGYSEGTIPDTFDGFLNLIHIDDRGMVENNITALLKGESEIYLSEYRMRAKQGIIWVRDRGSIIERDHQGRALRALGSIIDISSEKQQIELMSLLSSCLSATNDIVMIYDVATVDFTNPRIIYVNDTFCQVTGFSQEEAIGSSPRILQGKNTDIASLDKILLAIVTKQAINIDVLKYTKSGEALWLNNNIFPIADAQGKTTHMISIQRNVTLLKQQDLELRRAKEEAEQLSLVKTQFLANMSHEIRTPMNGVIGLSTLALESTDLIEIKQMVQKINQSSLSLMAILNDILDLSKIQEQGFSLDNSIFNLNELITQVNNLFTLTAQQSGVTYNMFSDQRIPDYLWGDELRIRQVLINLLGNAFKFTEQGKVSLSISIVECNTELTNDVRLKFCVTDTGIGLSTEQIALIFERFTQADSSVSRRFGGTGLGLTISQKLVLAMGGTIQVQSSVGQGSEFSFELDFKRMDTPPIPKVTNNYVSSVSNVLQGKRVLVVEDDDINQLVTGLLLKKIGVEYEVAENGAIAIERIKSQTYDLILMDIQMPIMDGIQATQHIRQIDDYKNLPIIAMSAGVMLEEKKACTLAGMNGFVSKPTNIDQLTREMLRLLT